MRYHYDKPKIFTSNYGTLYKCNHPIYDICTLFTIGDRGLAVIQQRFNLNTKETWWSGIDKWLNDQLYLHPNFKSYFDKHARNSKDGLYPTVTIRQIMWGLKMKPLKRERWETLFDRPNI